MDKEQSERELAEDILKKNEDIIQAVMNQADNYALQGRSDLLYLFSKALIVSLKLANAKMKVTLGVDKAKAN